MERYFFDTRDDDAVIADEIGVELSGLERAKELAATSLAELALEVLPGRMRRRLGVDVRDASGTRVLSAEMTFEARILV